MLKAHKILLSKESLTGAYVRLSYSVYKEDFIMPQNKKQGVILSLTMSLIMIYIMAALNLWVRDGVSAEAWLTALQRLPLGYIVGIICDMCICTPISRKIVDLATTENDSVRVKTFILRFSMVILMTVAMTVFSCVVSGKFGMEGVADFFTYLPYNFIIALPIQMLIVAPLSLKFAKAVAKNPKAKTVKE